MPLAFVVPSGRLESSDVIRGIPSGEDSIIEGRKLFATDTHVKERVAVGRPIGRLQAFAHECPDMAIEVEGAISVTYSAAWVVSENGPEASLSERAHRRR